MPGFSAHHYLPELVQTHAHWVSGNIQPFHPLSPPSPFALNFPQYQGLYQWVSSSHQVAKVLELHLQHLSSIEYSGLISFRIDCLISLLSKGFSRVFSSTIVWKHQFFGAQPSLWSNSHIHTRLLEKPYLWLYGPLLAKWYLCFKTLSRLDIAFLTRSKCLFILWLHSPSTLILEPKKMKSDTVSTFSPSICHEVIGPDTTILVFWMLSFKPAFLLSSFTFIKKLFSSSSLSAIKVVSSAHLKLLIFVLAILIPACASSSLAFPVMYCAYTSCICMPREGGLPYWLRQ